MTTFIPLNRGWFFSSFNESHLKHVHLEHFESIEIPHNAVDIPYQYVDERTTWKTFTYVKTIEIEDHMLHQSLRLRFEGVAHKADVYINHEHAHTHLGGYVPFEVDLTSYNNEKQSLTLMVIVDTKEDFNIPPFGGVVDYLSYGGIYREVSLIVSPVAHIVDVFIEQYGKPDIKVHVKTSVEGGSLTCLILDETLKIVGEGKANIHQESTILPIIIEDPILWDIEKPYLYHAKIIYKHQTENDECIVDFGFREAIFKRDGFYLNQRKIKLRGLNRHQSYPYVGYAMPKNAHVEDADIIKYQLGCNIVRTSHYPQSKHFLKRCDLIGLLVFEEIPGWQHIGDEKWQQQSLYNVEKMIERDRNHPSIILWGVRINESPDNDAFYQKTNALAMALDPTRQRGGVRNFANSHFFEDVYTYNDFSHVGTNKGLEKKKNITKDVPYLVTEFNGHMFPTKRFDDEKHRVSHLKRHLNVLNEGLKDDNGISGVIGWVFSDYNTHKEFGSGDRICYHGVLDMYRIPKYASYAYAVEQDDIAILEVMSTMNIGDHPAGFLDDIYVMTNVDAIKLYKNDVYIKTFYPDKKRYSNLKHPPIIINDLIGETLMKQEKMTYKDAELTKSVLRAVSMYGNHLPLRYKLKMLFILKKYKKTYDDAVNLFYRYMTGWGSTHSVYRFEGYRQDVLVKTVIKEPTFSTDLIVESSDRDLLVEDTYDVKRYVIKKVDQNHNILPYAFDPINISVEGDLSLIGPRDLTLIGGAIAFWVKATKAGHGVITINHRDVTIIEEVDIYETKS